MPRVLNMPVYTEFCRKLRSYMFDRVLSILRVLDMLGLEYKRVVHMPRLYGVLCKLYFKDSWYLECLEF